MRSRVHTRLLWLRYLWKRWILSSEFRGILYSKWLPKGRHTGCFIQLHNLRGSPEVWWFEGILQKLFGICYSYAWSRSSSDVHGRLESFTPKNPFWIDVSKARNEEELWDNWMTAHLGLKKEQLKIILVFCFVKSPAAGEWAEESAEFNRSLRRCKPHAEYPSKFGVTSDNEINKNQYKMDEISHL